MTQPQRSAADAITESIQTTSIVTLPYDAAVADDLLVACEDSTDTETATEYWGTDDDGQEWRVHMAVQS